MTETKWWGHFPEHPDQLAEIAASLPLLQSYGLNLSKAKQMLKRISLDLRSHVITAHVDQKLAGWAWVEEKSGFGVSPYLHLLVVSDSVQNQGVGQTLMQEIEKRFLKDYGLFVLCNSKNEGARRFYERLGYLKLGEIPAFVRADCDEVIYFKAGR